MITASTKLTAVIGNPIGHSRSPEFHSAEYAKRGIDAVMLAFAHDDVGALVQAVRTLGIELTAVTLPHKEKILPFLDEVDPLAVRIGAVNTVIQKDGRLLGFNTDYVGIAAALEGVEIAGKTVLILGAGGAARPLAAYVQDQGGNLLCLNRDHERAEALIKGFGGKVATEADALNADVIVNATPVGMHPNVEASPLDKKYLRAGQVVFDFVYNPEETRLLREAREAGAEIRSGKHMFEAQALKQIQLWENLILHL